MPKGENQRIPIQLGKHSTRLPYTWNEGGHTSDKLKSFTGIRRAHGENLLKELRSAEKMTEQQILPTLGDDYLAEKGFILTFVVDPGFATNLQTFDSVQSGVELLNVKLYEVDAGFMTEATVFVAHGSLKYFVSRLEKYIEKESNGTFIDPIQAIGLATLENLWTVEKPLPNLEKLIWWELWIRRGKTENTRKNNVEAIRSECEKYGFVIQDTELILPEHTVILMEAKTKDLTYSFGILNCLAEVREPVKAVLASFSSVVEIQNLEVSPPTPPADNAPSVCVLDTGVNRNHPLLDPICPENACDSWDQEWTSADNDGHGTEMCGLAAFGDLRPVNEGGHLPEATHWIESVKILNDPNAGEHRPENYGAVTVECMAIIEQAQTRRSNRVFSMAITAEDAPDFQLLAPDGLPTSWSSAIDKATVSYLDPDQPRRIFVVSGGNSFPDSTRPYPTLNFEEAFQDPAQSWNAISVGANTHYADVFQKCAAEVGGLSPYSRTTLKWDENGGADCPLKPEVVFEGGNSYADVSKISENLQPLSLEKQFLSDGLFNPTGATSAATAGIARLAAQIHHALPDAWPETVRALLVNSARWNDTMLKGVKLTNKGNVSRLIRTFGYGEPSFERAVSCSRSRATVYFEEEIQPFYNPKGKSIIETKEMIYFPLPIPKNELERMGESRVRLHVTLSYFIEPNPGRRGLAKSKFRYANCGLRFDLKSATESIDTFLANRSKKIHQRLSQSKKGDRGKPSKGWILGTSNQNRGSIHQDIWNGKAVELASRDGIVVFPVDGWWKLRPKLERWDGKQRFALVVTIETEDGGHDIFTAVEEAVQVLSVPQRVKDIEAMFETMVGVSI
jgi:hypothetical protein